MNVGGSVTFNSTGNLVDGVINNFAEDGEPRQNLPEDAVEEFKVSNVQYKAEFGLATGGIVQVVTKSGTNTLHGTAFEYFRDKSLNALGVFEAEKPAYRRNQFGGSVGGPLLRDRIHYFGAAERTKVDEFYTVFTGLPQFYSALEGTFAKPFTRNLYFGRVDGQVSNTQSFFARYAHEDERSTCNSCGGTTSSTAGFDQETPRRAVVVGHTWVRGTRQLNDFRFQYARAAYYISPAGTEVWTDISNNSAERLAAPDAAAPVPGADLWQQQRPDRSREPLAVQGHLRDHAAVARSQSSASTSATCRTSTRAPAIRSGPIRSHATSTSIRTIRRRLRHSPAPPRSPPVCRR